MLGIDVNVDVGESMTHTQWLQEQALLPLVSSVNIACGWHAGSASLMMQTVRAALAQGLAIGAHPGLDDLVGFGRRTFAISGKEVYNAVLYQIGALAAIVLVNGGRLHHVKPHGALYHMANADATLARAVCAAVRDFDGNLLLFAPPQGKLADAAKEKGLRLIGEAFIDRAYGDDRELLARNESGAVLTSAEEAVEQALTIAQTHSVRSKSGKNLPMPAQTLCIHGDNHHAMQLLQAVRTAFTHAAIIVQAPNPKE